MRRINKGDLPDFWEKYLKKNPSKQYKEAEHDIKHNMRMHMLKQQGFICAYCCKCIDEENSHNEHIKPQDKYPNYSMDFNNMVVSCKTINTCGNHKGNKYSEEQFVSPLDCDCESQFYFLQDGKICGTNEKANNTINLLNLNDYKLVSARKAVLRSCEDASKSIPECIKDYILDNYIKASNDGKLPMFCDMVKYFWDLGCYNGK